MPRTPVVAAVLAALACTAAAVPAPAQAAMATVVKTRVAVIAHRGAAGYRPENTLPAVQLAVAQEADFVEADLVPTKDGVLVVRNDNELSQTTDVAEHAEFAGRKVTKTVDGVSVTGWFTEDFTLAEVRTLRAKERIPALRPANTAYDGQFSVPTLAEFVDAVGNRARLYLELKHPTYFRQLGLALEPRVVAVLAAKGLASATHRVVLQAFEPSSLQDLARRVRLPLVQGLDVAGRPYDFTVAGDTRTYADLSTPAGLAWIARYARGVAANQNLIVPRDAANHLGQPTTLVTDAHTARLQVHTWTFRLQNSFLPAEFQTGTDPAAAGDLTRLLDVFYTQGVDAVFTENPDVAVAARL